MKLLSQKLARFNHVISTVTLTGNWKVNPTRINKFGNRWHSSKKWNVSFPYKEITSSRTNVRFQRSLGGSGNKAETHVRSRQTGRGTPGLLGNEISERGCPGTWKFTEKSWETRDPSFPKTRILKKEQREPEKSLGREPREIWFPTEGAWERDLSQKTEEKFKKKIFWEFEIDINLHYE